MPNACAASGEFVERVDGQDPAGGDESPESPEFEVSGYNNTEEDNADGSDK